MEGVQSKESSLSKGLVHAVAYIQFFHFKINNVCYKKQKMVLNVQYC